MRFEAGGNGHHDSRLSDIDSYCLLSYSEQSAEKLSFSFYFCNFGRSLEGIHLVLPSFVNDE